MGVDMAREQSLIAARMSLEEIRRHIDVDSLGYLSLEGLCSVVPTRGETHCQACFDGNYPVKVGASQGKSMFE